MISNKMKQDAAKINSEIKIIATKMPLVFNNYNYLNEDPKLVLKRRNEELDEIKDRCLKDFLNENATLTNILSDCEKDFQMVNEELKRFGVDLKLDDANTNNNSNDSDEALNNGCGDDASNSSGSAVDLQKRFTISREDSYIPNTPAIKCRKNLNL